MQSSLLFRHTGSSNRKGLDAAECMFWSQPLVGSTGKRLWWCMFCPYRFRLELGRLSIFSDLDRSASTTRSSQDSLCMLLYDVSPKPYFYWRLAVLPLLFVGSCTCILLFAQGHIGFLVALGSSTWREFWRLLVALGAGWKAQKQPSRKIGVMWYQNTSCENMSGLF